MAYQDQMVRAEALIAGQKFGEALQAIEKAQRPSGTHGTTWVLRKAQAAAGAGQAEQAYATLLESVAAAPDDRVQAALVKYAGALRKTRQDIDTDVWRIRNVTAAPAFAFELASSKDGKPVRLSDYRDRVVLVAFWFPG